MQHITTLVERHGLVIVFLNVLLARGGLPLPVIPTLITAAALAHQSFSQIIDIVLVGIGGTLIADFAQSEVPGASTVERRGHFFASASRCIFCVHGRARDLQRAERLGHST